MRAAIFNGPRDIRVGQRPDPGIKEPTDAVVRVVLGCVCGSGLWNSRGESAHAVGSIGLEFIGIVEDLGAEVTGLSRGDLVIAPFIYSDMSCPHCQNGSTISCARGAARRTASIRVPSSSPPSFTLSKGRHAACSAAAAIAAAEPSEIV